MAWRRVGERIDVERSGSERRLVHAFERGGSGPWEWTCASCGFAVRATGVLDNALARIQPARVPAIIGGLFGTGAGASAAGAGEGGGAGAVAAGAGRNLPGMLQAGAAAAAGVAAVAIIAVVASFGGAPAGGGGATATPAASEAAAATPAGMLTELAALTAGGADVAGRRLELERAEVMRVTGDTTFWLGTAGSEAFVVLDEARQPERSVTVRAGQQVRLTGTVHETPPDGIDLTAEDRAALEDVPVYVVADRVEIVSD